jgi:hypothetical protein
MNWPDILSFARGPLFKAALLVFIGGLAYRLFRVLSLGWRRDRAPRNGSAVGGTIVAYLKSILFFPFIPWVRKTFPKNVLTYLAGGLFHLSLFLVLVFGLPHMLVAKSLTGARWPTLPTPVIDWAAATGIAAMIFLLANRFAHPVLRKISGWGARWNWLVVFLPMVTGYMTTHHMFRYEAIFSLHVLSVDLLLVWIPFSRISHFLFYFFSKTIHGAQAGKRGVTP